MKTIQNKRRERKRTRKRTIKKRTEPRDLKVKYRGNWNLTGKHKKVGQKDKKKEIKEILTKKLS